MPPQLAAWIPPGVPHRLGIITDADLWMVQWQPSAIAAWLPTDFPDHAFASKVTPLLQSLLAAAVEGDASSVKAVLVVRLILLELSAVSDAPTYLPMPKNPVAKRVADIALVDYNNCMDLNELASRAATSVRTASRLFPIETGMSLKAGDNEHGSSELWSSLLVEIQSPTWRATQASPAPLHFPARSDR